MAIKNQDDFLEFKDIYENKICDKCGNEKSSFCSNQITINKINRCKLSYVRKEIK